MVLGSFQCRGLLWDMVGQGPAVLAADVGRMGCCFILYLHFLIPPLLGDGLTFRNIVKHCGLVHYNPAVVVSNYRRCARQVLVNRLAGLSLPKNSVNG